MEREHAGFSQRELARRTETTQAVVARLELGGDQRMPSLALISKLLHAAGAKLGYALLPPVLRPADYNYAE